jgi:hypothetical protein
VHNKTIFIINKVFTSFFLKPVMDLKMFIGEELIDVVSINIAYLHHPGYIQSLKMEMEEKNEDIIDLSEEKPTFFIDNVPSSMNIPYRSLRRLN